MAGVFKPDVSGSGGTAASQAQQEAGSAIDVFTSPGRQHYHPSAAKAWVHFNGSGTLSVAASYNVSSVTDVNTGLYAVNFSTAFSSVSYGVVTMIGSESDSGRFSILGVSTIATVAHVRISNQPDNANVDSTRVAIAAFGDQS